MYLFWMEVSITLILLGSWSSGGWMPAAGVCVEVRYGCKEQYSQLGSHAGVALQKVTHQ